VRCETTSTTAPKWSEQNEILLKSRGTCAPVPHNRRRQCLQSMAFRILYSNGMYKQGRFYGTPGWGPMKNVVPSGPHFGPASLDFHLNRPVISLIQLHIVHNKTALLYGAMRDTSPSWNCGRPIAPHLASVRTAPVYKLTLWQKKPGCTCIIQVK